MARWNARGLVFVAAAGSLLATPALAQLRLGPGSILGPGPSPTAGQTATASPVVPRGGGRPVAQSSNQVRRPTNVLPPGPRLASWVEATPVVATYGDATVSLTAHMAYAAGTPPTRGTCDISLWDDQGTTTGQCSSACGTPCVASVSLSPFLGAGSHKLIMRGASTTSDVWTSQGNATLTINRAQLSIVTSTTLDFGARGFWGYARPEFHGTMVKRDLHVSIGGNPVDPTTLDATFHWPGLLFPLQPPGGTPAPLGRMVTIQTVQDDYFEAASVQVFYPLAGSPVPGLSFGPMPTTCTVDGSCFGGILSANLVSVLPPPRGSLIASTKPIAGALVHFLLCAVVDGLVPNERCNVPVGVATTDQNGNVQVPLRVIDGAAPYTSSMPSPDGLKTHVGVVAVYDGGPGQAPTYAWGEIGVAGPPPTAPPQYWP